MPTRRNDALDAHLNAYFQIASTGVNRNGTMLTETAPAQLRDMLYTVQPIIVPARWLPVVTVNRMFDSASVSFEIATEEPQEEAGVESNEELDNFLKEFALKEVC